MLPNVYKTDGLCYSLPLYMHKDPAKEVKSALRAKRDWKRVVNHINDYKGGLGDRFHFISVTVPECLTERLEIIS